MIADQAKFKPGIKTIPEDSCISFRIMPHVFFLNSEHSKPRTSQFRLLFIFKKPHPTPIASCQMVFRNRRTEDGHLVTRTTRFFHGFTRGSSEKPLVTYLLEETNMTARTSGRLGVQIERNRFPLRSVSFGTWAPSSMLHGDHSTRAQRSVKSLTEEL